MRETVNCDISDLGNIIGDMVTEFSQEVCDGLKEKAKDAVEKLENSTKADANEDSGKYAKAISSKVLKETPTSITYVWYVKGRHSRLTHLLVKGHGMKNGGRTRANPFLQKHHRIVKKEYEKNCEKVIDDAAG